MAPSEAFPLEPAPRYLAAIVASSNDAIIGKTLDGVITFWNPAAERLYGYTPAEAVGAPIAMLAPPERRDEIPAIMERLRRGERIEHYETVRMRKDGERLHVSISISPIADAAGQIIGAATIARDITGQVRVRAALEHSERLARAAAEQTRRLQQITSALTRALTPTEIAAVIVEQGIEAVGAAAGVVAVLTEAGQLDLLGERGLPTHIVDPWRRLPIEAPLPLAEAARARTPLWFPNQAAYSAAYPDLATRTLPHTGTQALAVLPLIVDGRTVGALGFSFAEAREFAAPERLYLETLAGLAAQAMERARLYEAARAAVQARDEFLAGAAHELRTPITGLRGYAQILRRQIERTGTADPEQLTRSLSQIEQQSVPLADLVGQLLDVARLQSGRLLLARRPADLAALLRDAVATWRGETGRDIRLDAPPELRANVDPLRVEQVVANLLGNALKFSQDDRPIEVELRLEGNGQVARLTVRDYGIGIAPEHLPRIFERFHRVTPDHTAPGLGLGLFISRQIAEQHGGSLEVESRPGEGSSFSLRLPI